MRGGNGLICRFSEVNSSPGSKDDASICLAKRADPGGEGGGSEWVALPSSLRSCVLFPFFLLSFLVLFPSFQRTGPESGVEETILHYVHGNVRWRVGPSLLRTGAVDDKFRMEMAVLGHR